MDFVLGLLLGASLLITWSEALTGKITSEGGDIVMTAADVVFHVDSGDTSINALKTANDQQTQNTASLLLDASSLDSTLSTLSQSLGSLASSYATSSQVEGHISSGLSSLEDSLSSAISSTISSALLGNTYTDAQIDIMLNLATTSVNGKISAMNATINSLVASTLPLASSLNATVTAVSNISSSVDALKAQVDSSVLNAIGPLNSTLSSLQNTVSQLNDGLQDFKSLFQLGGFSLLPMACRSTCNQWTPDLTLPFNQGGAGEASSNQNIDLTVGESIPMAFDNDPRTYWHTCGDVRNCPGPSSPSLYPPHWILYDFGNVTKKMIEGYGIQRRVSFGDQAPRDWYFQGSFDKISWTTLDSRSNISFPSDSTIQQYTFCNDRSFRYYRLYITATNGGGNNTLYACSIGEFQLYERASVCSGSATILIDRMKEPSLIIAATPNNVPSSVPATCADILAANPQAPSGYYWIKPSAAFSGPFMAYCLMDPQVDGGGWTLCAHAAPQASGSKNWFDADATATNPKQATVLYQPGDQSERAWCGLMTGVGEVLVETRNLAMTDGAARVVFDWQGRKPSQLPTGIIRDDVRVIMGGIDMTPMRTDPTYESKWEDANMVINEDFYISYTDRNTRCINAGFDNSGQVCSAAGPYFQIGSHKNGAHQHYEEYICNTGALYGNGDIEAGKYWGNAGTNPNGFPVNAPAAGTRCATTGHVFFFFRSGTFASLGLTIPSVPSSLPSSCAAILASSPSSQNGYYWIQPPGNMTMGPVLVYCLMDSTVDGGGWTLCAHAGGRASGAKNWFDQDPTDVYPNDIYASGTVFYSNKLHRERAWCGRVPALSQVLVEVRNDSLTDTPTRVRFNWENRTASQLPTGKIADDVKVLSGGISMTPDRTDQYAPNWEDSSNVISEDFYISYADRNTKCINAGFDSTGQVCSSVGPYFQIGSHNGGAHQHYEEFICNSGAANGNGDIEAGKFYGFSSSNPNSFPMRSPVSPYVCLNSGHVFFYYR